MLLVRLRKVVVFVWSRGCHCFLPVVAKNSAGGQGGVGADIAVPLRLVGGIHKSVAGNGVLLSVGPLQVGGLGAAGQDDGGSHAVVGDKGNDLMLVIDH